MSLIDAERGLYYHKCTQMRKEREVRERGFLIAILITACVLDLSRGRIPNGLCVAGWMISLLLHVMEEGSTGVRIWLTGGCLSFGT